MWHHFIFLRILMQMWLFLNMFFYIWKYSGHFIFNSLIRCVHNSFLYLFSYAWCLLKVLVNKEINQIFSIIISKVEYIYLLFALVHMFHLKSRKLKFQFFFNLIMMRWIYIYATSKKFNVTSCDIISIWSNFCYKM